jgi:hypothetical protein
VCEFVLAFCRLACKHPRDRRTRRTQPVTRSHQRKRRPFSISHCRLAWPRAWRQYDVMTTFALCGIDTIRNCHVTQLRTSLPPSHPPDLRPCISSPLVSMISYPSNHSLGVAALCCAHGCAFAQCLPPALCMLRSCVLCTSSQDDCSTALWWSSLPLLITSALSSRRHRLLLPSPPLSLQQSYTDHVADMQNLVIAAMNTCPYMTHTHTHTHTH